MRRSMLFIPGANPKQVMFAGTLGSDCVIFDLEDAVSPTEKDSARILVRNLIKTQDYNNVEICVRVNSLDSPFWETDLSEIVPYKPNLIMTPKIESDEDVLTFESTITKIEKENNITVGSTKLVLLIETARGIENCYQAACASERVVSLALGGEDYTANLQCKRTVEGNEIDYARKRIVNAARAASVEIYDTPNTDAHNDTAVVKDAAYAKSLGFSGKLAITPRHVDAINHVFSPSQADVDHAFAVKDAIDQAKKMGQGVVALNGKMIDKPVEMRALRTIKEANELGLKPSKK